MAQTAPTDIDKEKKKRRVVYIALAIFGGVAFVNYLIFLGVGGSTLIQTLEADGTWAIAVLALLVVVFEYERTPPATPPPSVP